MKYPTIMAVLFLLVRCSTEEKQPSDQPAMLQQVYTYMIGSYSSEAQSLHDSGYYNIVLHMYPIWENKTYEGRWLYVEQALATLPGEPYRQRIYHLEQLADTLVTSTIYELPNPKKWIGEWTNVAAFEPLSRDSLLLRDGCKVFLRQAGSHFTGSTESSFCLSSYKGASYATTEVTVYSDSLISWDRGYNEDGEQVWGAEMGGYVFVKTSGTQ